jgi:hypothetical protein
MTKAELETLSAEEQKHFHSCQACGEYFDMRQLDEVMFHCTDHKPRPDIQYSGWERLDA